MRGHSGRHSKKFAESRPCDPAMLAASDVRHSARRPRSGQTPDKLGFAPLELPEPNRSAAVRIKVQPTRDLLGRSVTRYDPAP
jgi:hypothetical protein